MQIFLKMQKSNFFSSLFSKSYCFIVNHTRIQIVKKRKM